MDGRSEAVMWRSMKKKLYDFFFYEKIEMIEVIDEEKKQKQPKRVEPSERKIETKVVYEYPDKKNFRFPIIPDYEQKAIHKRDETLEIPAYMRKERALGQSRSGEEYQVEQSRENHVSSDKESNHKVPVRSTRFVPTDVPSPIYGYNRRTTERDLRDTPAYIRRDMRSEHEVSVSNKDIAAADNRIVPSISEAKKEQPGETQEHIKQETHTIDQKPIWETKEDKIQAKYMNQQVSDIDPPPQTEESVTEPVRNHSSSLESKEKEPEDYKKQRTTPVSKTSTKTTQSDTPDIPFNVMMTRQDKIRYQRQQEKQQKDTHQETHIQQSKSFFDAERVDYSIPMHLLDDPIKKDETDKDWIMEQRHLLEETFLHFNVDAAVVNVTQGPSVTRFEVQPALGVKVSKVRNLSDDIKLNLSAKDIRIEAPIPGKNTIGIEIPNLHAQTVGLYEILHDPAFTNSRSELPIGLGVTIEGKPLITDVADMPHGLIAGATGSGKSVCINTILLSLLYKNHYDDVKLMLIDPKMVELTPYNGIPHLVSPVITDVKAATAALKWAVEEMEGRYERFVEEGVRDIHRFNAKVTGTGRTTEKMPFIVIVIDELADLMMMAPQDVEDSICRIAQKARACGMHLLIATQRPSVDVITGLIKANVPTRIAFSVSSQVDSRTIIDTNGAERLLGKGDMLFIENGKGKSIRLQGAFVSDEEIDRVVQMVKETGPAQYLFEEEQLLEMTTEIDDDPLLEEVISFIVEQQRASTSMLQRQFRVGYNRAARLMESLEQRGIISGQNGSKPRDVILRK